MLILLRTGTQRTDLKGILQGRSQTIVLLSPWQENFSCRKILIQIEHNFFVSTFIVTPRQLISFFNHRAVALLRSFQCSKQWSSFKVVNTVGSWQMSFLKLLTARCPMTMELTGGVVGTHTVDREFLRGK